MIDEIIQQHRFDVEKLPPAEAFAKAKTAIYEIGLGVIGAGDDAEEIWRGLDKESRENVFPEEIGANYVNPRNLLRIEQRKAWAKACGVAEK